MANKVWASTSSTDPSVGGNWSPSGVPTATDTVYFDGAVSNVNIDTALTTLNGVALTAVHILDSYTGLLGSATAPLEIEATDFYIHKSSGQANSQGSRRLWLDIGSTNASVTVTGSATTSADAGQPPVRICGTGTNNFYISGSASVGIGASSPIESCTITTLNTMQGAAGGAPTVTVGEGVTFAAFEISAGDVLNRGANVSGASLVTGGTYRVLSAATHAALTVRDTGQIIYESDGSVSGTIVVSESGTLDLSRDARAKTVSKIEASGSATVELDNGNPASITITNGIDVIGANVTVNLPAGGINLDLTAV